MRKYRKQAIMRADAWEQSHPLPPGAKDEMPLLEQMRGLLLKAMVVTLTAQRFPQQNRLLDLLDMVDELACQEADWRIDQRLAMDDRFAHLRRYKFWQPQTGKGS